MGKDIQNDRPGKNRFVAVAVIYVLGLFIGALNTGIITPARTIIQGSLGVDSTTGIWMINIYTLAYAAAIPIAGKLADKIGRKYIYIVSILLFGIGSVICGISSLTGDFTLLLAGRVVQALGGGGIMPIATAEFGTSFPEEKRGMALGIVGGVYGIANILGSTVGSAILNIAGNDNWQWLFYINIPICLLIMAFGLAVLPNHKAGEVKKIDKLGTLVIVAMILSLLYGLKGINFFDFMATVTSTNVYPFLVAFVIMLPLFVLIERKAEDPILNLSYFTNRQIVITLILSFIVGLSMMGMVFVPQFAENTLKIPTGTGGYFVAILGLFSGVAAPVSGNLIDRLGVKKVLGVGFLISVIGSLFLIFVTIPYSSFLTVCISLLLIGLGLGFTMGTPINYMMLNDTKQEESNSALAAVSLIRSIGTAIAPAIMVGFISQAGMQVQDNLMNMLPQPATPKMEQAQELTDYFSSLKNNKYFAEKMKGMEMPDFSKMGDMKFNMSGGGTLPEDILKSFQTADVTNITDRVKVFADRMFRENTPAVIEKIQNGIQTGADNMKTGLSEMEKAEADMKKGADGISQGIAEMQEGRDGIAAGMAQMQTALDKQDAAIAQMTEAYNAMKSGKMPAGVMSTVKMPAGMPAGMTAGTTTGGAMTASSMPAGMMAGMTTGTTTGSAMTASSMPADMMAGTTTGTTTGSAMTAPSMPAGMPAGMTAGTTTGSAMTASSMPAGMPAGTTTGTTTGSAMIASDSGHKEDIASRSGMSGMTGMPSTSGMTGMSGMPGTSANSGMSMDPGQLKAQIDKLTSARNQLAAKLEEMASQKKQMEAAMQETSSKRSQLLAGIDEMDKQKASMESALDKMQALKASIPGFFDQSRQDYLNTLEGMRPEMEKTFKDTLNEGFRMMFLFVAAANLLALVILLFYSTKRKEAVPVKVEK